MPDPVNEFEIIAVSRDLFRRPEVRVLAGALAQVNAATGSVVDKNDIAPIYIMLAHRLLSDPIKRRAIVQLLELLV